MKDEKRRYVGIDLGKREYTMAIIGKNEKASFRHGRTSITGREALYRLLEKEDKVALEAGNLAFRMAEEIQERVGSEVRVLNSAKLPYIWDAPTKTDKEDALKLAHLIEERRDEKLPIVPLPSKQEQERRKVVANYQREIESRTRLLNQLHAMFVSAGITTVVKKDISAADCRQAAIKVLSGQELEEAETLLEHLALYDKRIAQLKKKIQDEANSDGDMKLLQSIAGVGPIVAYAFAAHVGDGSRFSKGAQVSNYIGFVPRLYYSGDTKRNGHITKRGNGYLRALLIQGAWALTMSKKGGSLKERFIYLTKGQGRSKKKTIVSIARRLAELMYTVLRSKTKYEPRPWKGSGSKAKEMAEKAMSA